MPAFRSSPHHGSRRGGPRDDGFRRDRSFWARVRNCQPSEALRAGNDLSCGRCEGKREGGQASTTEEIAARELGPCFSPRPSSTMPHHIPLQPVPTSAPAAFYNYNTAPFRPCNYWISFLSSNLPLVPISPAASAVSLLSDVLWPLARHGTSCCLFTHLSYQAHSRQFDLLCSPFTCHLLQWITGTTSGPGAPSRLCPPGSSVLD